MADFEAHRTPRGSCERLVAVFDNDVPLEEWVSAVLLGVRPAFITSNPICESINGIHQSSPYTAQYILDIVINFKCSLTRHRAQRQD